VLTTQKNQPKLDVSTQCDLYVAASKILRDAKKKHKCDTHTIAFIEILSLEYHISPEKYFGGKLNGVNSREVISQAY
jgi:hypothetical protein